MAPQDIIAKIQSTDSKNSKIEIIALEAKNNHDDFFAGLKMAFDAMITFGVKKIDTKTSSSSGNNNLSFATFKQVADQLASRELSGDAAKCAIAQLANKATTAQWNDWYRRILIKDMGAGFSEKSVNKAVAGINSAYAIDVFEVQLAEPVDSVDTPFVGKKMINVKYDGMRCISIMYPSGHVTQYSRNGKELLNFNVVRQQLAKAAKLFKVPMVLDGEIMSTSFQDLMKQAHRKSDVQSDDSVLYVFDMLPLSAFKDKIYKVTLKNRVEHLKSWYETAKHALPNVDLVGDEVVDLDTLDGQERLSTLNTLALQQKYEGLMIKSIDSYYECRRSTDWLKMKPFIEESLTIVAVNEGTKKLEGTMGSLTCDGIVNGQHVQVDVGSGWSMQTRAQIWADHTKNAVTWKKKEGASWLNKVEHPSGQSVLGHILEVRADCITKSDGNDTYSMRFPRAKTFRGFVQGEKI